MRLGLGAMATSAPTARRTSAAGNAVDTFIWSIVWWRTQKGNASPTWTTPTWEDGQPRLQNMIAMMSVAELTSNLAGCKG